VSFVEIRVLFFGILKDVMGRDADTLNLSEGATISDLLSHYERVPHMRELLPSIATSVNQEYASPDVRLSPADEVALLPPVSGGAGEPRPAADDNGQHHFPRCAIVHHKIDTDAVLQRLKHDADGAAVVFEGIVRNNTRGRRTLYLDYEAYEGMALKQLHALIDQALQQFKIREVAVVHRLGRLEIGETSVLIVVTSAHRGPAFEACRWIIDTLKRTVPIWKKEYFQDGAVWADGEPFPPEILSPEGTPATKPASK
jgi:molybdopterin synthase catalytic subunit